MLFTDLRAVFVRVTKPLRQTVIIGHLLLFHIDENPPAYFSGQQIAGGWDNFVEADFGGHGCEFW